MILPYVTYSPWYPMHECHGTADEKLKCANCKSVHRQGERKWRHENGGSISVCPHCDHVWTEIILKGDE